MPTLEMFRMFAIIGKRGERNVVSLKDMVSGNQDEISMEDLVNKLSSGS